MHISRWWIGCLALFFITSLAYSQPYRISNKRFSSEDMHIMARAAHHTLENAYDGEKIKWFNPNTGAGGYFIATGTKTRNGVKCRELIAFNAEPGSEGKYKSEHQFCRYNGHWGLSKTNSVGMRFRGT